MTSFEEIMAEIKKLYNKNPLDWQISVSKDRHNHGNILITNPNYKSLWQIKIDSLYRPNPISVGAKIKDFEIEDNINSNLPSFGYRPLFDEQLEQLQNKLMDKKPVDKLILDILQNEPVSLKNTKSKGFLEGPVTFTPPGYISKRQKELDLKLKSDLDKLKYRKGLGLQYL
ncbi:MAG: hypothetical protein ACTSO9_20480 [Candidatus Helarchaeota archaeon]